MVHFVKVIKKSELADGEKKTVIVFGKKIMIVNIGGKFFAMNDACTHMGCSLGTEGFLTGSTITCRCHRGQFNAMTGKVIAPPPSKDAQIYAVKVEGDDVWVSV